MSQKRESQTILAIVAHPDDIDIVAGGTVARWIQDGNQVDYCIVTNGDAGSDELEASADAIANIRSREQEEAASVLGVASVHFLGHQDGRLNPTHELRIEIATLIRKLKPQWILTHSPVYNLKSIRFSHPDHLAVGQAVLAAVFPDARNPHAFKETQLSKLEPHQVEQVWLMGAPNPNKYVDMTLQIDVKIKAVSCHTSQLEGYGDLNDFFYSWGRELALDAGYEKGKLAEAFFLVDTR